MMGSCDKNHHLRTPQTYDLKQHCVKGDCNLLKVSYLVYFDWYEEVEMKAHNILRTVALISDCNKFLSASVNQLY